MKPAKAAGIAPDALRGVREYRDRETHQIVGLMTGTSADAIDAALVRIGSGDRVEVLAYRETPLGTELRSEVLAVASAETIAPERMMKLDAALGERYAAAVLELLAAARVDPSAVDALGCHGQTIRHLPRQGAHGRAFTLQIGSAPVLAERTGITVVSDFRSRDTAAGGEGAPLVPLVDWWLFRSDRESRLLLNLGGMANVTYLPAGGGVDRVSAFDTGPGNAVIDALVSLQTAGLEVRDDGGSRAARGIVHGGLLDQLLADPFFEQSPPRSTGRERFGGAYAARLLALSDSLGIGGDDVLATATELTAASVGLAIERFILPHGPLDAVYASGGGVHNRTMMAALERRVAPARLARLEEIGIDPGAKEAVAFALLAHRTLCGLPGNVRGATGASRPVVLGTITPGGR